MEQETTAVEHDLGDAGSGCRSGNALADIGSGIGSGAGLAAHVLVQGRRGGQGLALRIVNDLGVDVTARTVDAEARTGARNSLERGANATTTPREEGKLCHRTSSSLPCGR